MYTLFEPSDPQKPVQPGKRCRNCIHGYEHQYGNMFYCSKQRQRGTAYGHKKIKKLAPACSMFEAKQKEV